MIVCEHIDEVRGDFARLGREVAIAREMTDYEARVARGAMLLDATVPEWAGRIDLDALDIGECERCVIGQLFGDYRDVFLCDGAASDMALATLGLRSRPDFSWRADHGFTEFSWGTVRHDILRAAWVAEVEARRQLKGES